MATIVNARDVALQSASPRFLGVQLGSNIQVPINNVPGLSTALSGVREVSLSGTSQLFQIPKTGSIAPASITVAAKVAGLTGTPTLTIVSGTMSVVPALTAGVFTFTAAQMTSDVVTLRLSLTDSGTTYTDDYTVVKVREGADGITGFLTNESCTVAADKLGNVTSYTGVSGNFKVFQGANDVTSACTFSVPTGGNPNSLTYSLTANGAGAGTYSVSAGFPAGVDQTSLTIRATFGTTVLDKVFSISKSKAGSDGAKGSDGTSGSRGSQTFYVAIAGTSFSDAVASSTASVNGGPIYGDVVTQYNNAAGYSLSKFWSGSGWTTINAVVDGNLLVQGTVGAQKLVVNNGSGNNLWWDASYQDASQWLVSSWGVLPTLYTVSDGSAGGFVARSPTGGGSMGTNSSSAITSNRVPVSVGKQYRISVKARKSSSSNNGRLYLRVDPNANKTGSYNGSNATIGLEDVSLTASWATYAGNFTATTPYLGVMVLINYDNTSGVGYQEWQDLRVEELMDSSLVVVGGISADRLDTRGLLVKDDAGNVILGSGSALNPAYAAAGTRNSDIAIGKNLIPNSDQSFSMSMAFMGWNGAVIDTPLQFSSNLWSSIYTLRGSTTKSLTLHQNNAVSGGNYVAAADIYPLGTWDLAHSVACVPGQRFCFSAYLNGHRCYVGVGIQFFDYAGNYISDVAAAATGTYEGACESLDQFIRVYNIGTAPTGAAYVRPYIRKFNSRDGTTESWIWIAAPQLEAIGSTASGPSDYSPGVPYSARQVGYNGDLNATFGAPAGSTVAGDDASTVVRPGNKISNGNIGTYMNSAAIDAAYIRSLSAGLISTGINGGDERVVVTQNRIDVYDATNARRVRLGLL